MENLYSVEQVRIQVSKTLQDEKQMGADEKQMELLEAVFSDFLLKLQRELPKATIN